MKKIKFFNGISATFALAVVALATTFTSCEKEEFNVKFDPNPAKVYFTPTVIDAATNAIVPNAQLTGAEEITGDKNTAIEAGNRIIKATANGVTGEVTVNFPKVEPGQVVALSPIIMLSSEFNFAEISTTQNNPEPPILGDFDRKGHDHQGNNWGENDTDYFYPFKATLDYTKEATIKSRDIYATSIELSKAIEAYKLPIEKAWSFDLKASAWCLFNAEFTITTADVKVAITSKANGEEVAKIVYVNPVYNVTAVATELPFPGHEHAYEHGHGHDGNNPNAGGGITLAD